MKNPVCSQCTALFGKFHVKALAQKTEASPFISLEFVSRSGIFIGAALGPSIHISYRFFKVPRAAGNKRLIESIDG